LLSTLQASGWVRRRDDRRYVLRSKLKAALHCTALGKVFLAFGQRPMPAEMEQYTNRTLTNAAAVEANLRDARRDGFASDDEEFSPGVRCVAAPIRRTGGSTVAAVGLSGPSVRIDARRLNELGRLLRDRCKTVVPSEENEE
jgi:DNA-binding IclR family transcriptional regulator